jgi:hypothetical protein
MRDKKSADRWSWSTDWAALRKWVADVIGDLFIY